MSQPDEFLDAQEPLPLWPEPSDRCSDCAGTGLLSDPVETCIYCDGLGERPEPQPTDAERRAAVRHAERCLFEPGYLLAVSYLAGLTTIERAALGKAA